MSNKRKKLSGFTLTEVMTSLVIMSIMIVMSSSVIITSFNIFGKNSVMRAAQNDGNNIYNYLYDHISYATTLKINENVDNNFSEESSYYEKITISKNFMTIKRKNITEPFYVYGEDGKNTLHGCNCIVEFKRYTEKSDTITFSVTLERDSEIFYTKQGNVPILNEELKENITIANNTDNKTADIKIICTYLE